MKYLLNRCISEKVININNLQEREQSIVIPIYDKDNNFLFNKYRLLQGKQKYKYDKGSSSTLYNTQNINKKIKTIYIVEGEFDACVLQSDGKNAVSSTGGASTFDTKWLEFYKDDFEFIISFDNDKAGIENAVKLFAKMKTEKYNVSILELLPIAKYNDVTDYFCGGLKERYYSLNKFIPEKLTAMDYELKSNEFVNPQYYMYLAQLVRQKEQQEKKVKKRKVNYDDKKSIIDNIKQIPITNFLEFDNRGFRKCLWHNEKSGSLHYRKETNRVKCFGCGFSGDVFDVLAHPKVEGLSFVEVIEKYGKN